MVNLKFFCKPQKLNKTEVFLQHTDVLTFSFTNMKGEVISETYVLEYGTDCLEMHVGAIEPRERVLIVDELVATGGTLCAAINLLGTYRIPFKYSRNFHLLRSSLY